MYRSGVAACLALLDTGLHTYRLALNDIMAGWAMNACGGLANYIFSRVGPLSACWIHREIFLRSARTNITNIPEIRFVIAAATDLLEIFKTIKAHHHLKILQ